MNQKTRKLIPRLVSDVSVILILLISSGLQAQQKTYGKFDEFGRVNAEDAMARLDQFAIELRSHPEWRGMIVASNTIDRNLPRGTLLRLAHGYRNYLVSSRGI